MAAAGLLAACSALRIGYATAPDLVYWSLDGYVDFNGDQTPRVREAIKQWFAWNRRTQLPDYAALLARARVEVLADTTPVRVCEWQAEGIQRAHTAFDRIAPAVLDTLLTLTPDQVQHLQQRYAKNNDDFRDDYLQPDLRERARKSLDRVVDRAETLYGNLDDKQRAAIVEALVRSPFDPQVWLAERQQRQQEVLAMARKFGSTGAPREEAQAALTAYVSHLEHSPREAYERYSQRLATFNCGFVAALHNSTSAAQRQHAAEKLAGWEGDLRALAAAAPAVPRGEP